MASPRFPLKTRQCGPCTACCTTCAVHELHKGCNEACVHLAVSGAGCSIYADRPESCRQFNCAWLQGKLPEKFRPDLSGIVFGADRRAGTKRMVQAVLLDADVPMQRVDYLVGILKEGISEPIIVHIVPVGMSCGSDWTLHFKEVRPGIFLADRQSTAEEIKRLEDAGFTIRGNSKT